MKIWIDRQTILALIEEFNIREAGGVPELRQPGLRAIHLKAEGTRIVTD